MSKPVVIKAGETEHMIQAKVPIDIFRQIHLMSIEEMRSINMQVALLLREAIEARKQKRLESTRIEG